MLKNYKRILLVSLIAIQFSSCTQDEYLVETQNELDSELISKESVLPPLSSSILLNEPYGNELKQEYDIYLPANRSRLTTKVILLIHGGGWRAGDKRSMERYIANLQETHPNHAIVNMNYTLAEPGVTYAFPNQFLDVQSLISSLSDKSEKYQILPEFGIIGRSAGAHLALMYDSVYDLDDKVKFVCSLAGPTNFNDPGFTTNPEFFQLMDAIVDPSVYPNYRSNLAALSPGALVSEITSPTLIFHGRSDTTVPLTNAIFLKNRLSSKGIHNRIKIFKGGHLDWSDENAAEIENRLAGYINKYLSIK